jgi:hypothetical protein
MNKTNARRVILLTMLLLLIGCGSKRPVRESPLSPLSPVQPLVTQTTGLLLATATSEPKLTPQPTLTPSPPPPPPTPDLPELTEVLPPGAVYHYDQIWTWGSVSREHYVVQVVPYTAADGQLDLAIIASQAGDSRLLWDLRDVRLELAPLSFSSQVLSPYGTLGVVVEESDNRWLLALEWQDDKRVELVATLPLNILDMPIASPPNRVQLVLAKDKVLDAILYFADTDEAVFYHQEPNGFSRQVAHLRAPFQMLDLEGDGAFELIMPVGQDRWIVKKWDGQNYVPGESLIYELPPSPEPLTVDNLPPLPTDLYFVRDNSLWQWLQEGGSFDLVVQGPSEPQMRGLLRPVAGGGEVSLGPYRLSADGRHLAYRVIHRDPSTHHLVPQLVVLDMGTSISVTVPIRAAMDPPEVGFFDLTPDGRWLIYLAYGVQPSTSSHTRGRGHAAPFPLPAQGGVDYGTIFAVDTTDPNREFKLGYCASRQTEEYRWGCDGLLLSPDGKHLALSDGRGLWVVAVPDGTPRLLVEHSLAMPHGLAGVHRPLSWSPDGRRLLVTVGYYEGGAAALWDVETGQAQLSKDTFVYAVGRSDFAWLPDGSGIVHARSQGSAALTIIATDDTNQVTPLLHSLTFDTPSSHYNAISPHILVDGSIGFSLRHSNQDLYHVNGIFRIQSDGSGWEQIAGLPSVYREDQDSPWQFGKVLWSPKGQAFLFVDRQGYDWPPTYRTLLLGLTDGSGLWDMGEVLDGASEFQWGPGG